MMKKEIIQRYFQGKWDEFFRPFIQDGLKSLSKDELQGLCPFHKESNPSFTINSASGLWKCFGCDQGGDPFDFWAKLKGLSTKKNFPQILKNINEYFNLNGGDKRRKKDLGPITAKFDYTDEIGNLLFQVCRYDPIGEGKTFRQRRPDGNGGWLWGLGNVKPVLYKLPDLSRAQEIYIAEGERDVLSLCGLGLTATCNAGGAGKWRLEYSESLREKNCVILPDNDQPGRKHAQQVAKSLYGIAASVKILELPGLGEKEDISDFIQRQPDREAAFERLSIMIESTKPWLPKPKEKTVSMESPAAESDISSFALTDMGNAERLVNRHGQGIHFCYPWGKWLFWAGDRWIVDESGEMERKAKETVRAICKEVTNDMDSKHVEDIYKHASHSESDSRIQAMIKLSRSEVPVMPDELDKDIYLLNTLNGTIDLKNKKLLPHNREYLITKKAHIEYDPDADCPLWKNFLDRIMAGNLSLIEFLQRIIGYSLTGDIREQCFLILYGTGANGKTTFLETIRALLGDYAQQADFGTFLVKRYNNGASNDIAALKGSRFVSAIEAGVGRSLNEALIKQLTGGEPVRARFLYGEFFEFHPEFKLFLATNHKPRIKETDTGIWRRVRLIPFSVTIPKHEQDHTLLEKLNSELPGILNWALNGCCEWLKNGLQEPAVVETATIEYRAAEDVLGAFIDDSCLLSQGSCERTSELKNAYKEWCDVNGEEMVNNRVFVSLLESRGCKRGRDNNSRYWMGIALKK